jgi:hypothetical protein
VAAEPEGPVSRPHGEAALGHRLSRNTPPNLPPRPDRPPPFPSSVTAALDAGLASLSCWWLICRCGGCGAQTDVPLRLLAAKRGWNTPLRQVVPRLSCQACKARPSTVRLVANPAAMPGTMHGGGPDSAWLNLLGE